MPRRLLALNVLFVAASLVAVVYIVRELRAPGPPAPGAARAAAPTVPVAAAPSTPPPPGSYAVIASRNLFSPTRSEAPASAALAGAGAPVVKPNLHGVVLRDGAPIAYLEDPATKRVAGYRLGDTIGGGSLQTIAADHVVIARPDGNVDVRLRDPSRPRPPVPVAAPGLPGMPLGQGVTAPGVTPFQGPMPPASEVQPLPPNVQLPIPGRRPLPPNLLRRLPPASAVPQQ